MCRERSGSGLTKAQSPFVRHPRPVRESSCPAWSFLPVAWFLSDWCFPFPLFRSGGLEIQFPRPLLILFIGRDVSGPLSQR